MAFVSLDELWTLLAALGETKPHCCHICGSWKLAPAIGSELGSYTLSLLCSAVNDDGISDRVGIVLFRTSSPGLICAGNGSVSVRSGGCASHYQDIYMCCCTAQRTLTTGSNFSQS